MGWDGTRLSRILRGTYRISGDDVRKLARVMGVDDPEGVEEVARVAEEPPGKGWWAPYTGHVGQNYLDFVEMEAEAETIRMHHPVVIPGLIQSAGYAREILTRAATRERDPKEILISIRMARQEVLTRRDKPVDFHALVPEPALHAQFESGPTLMKDQLRKLIDASELPNVKLQIVPLSAHPAYVTKGPITLLTFQHPWSPVASVDNAMGGNHTEDPEQVEYLEADFDAISSVSYSADESRELLIKYLEGMHE